MASFLDVIKSANHRLVQRYWGFEKSHAWLQSGYPCLSLHGGKDQSDRESTISDFKSNVCNVLVATSVAARGLDVKDLVRPRPLLPIVAPPSLVALVCHGAWVAHARHSKQAVAPPCSTMSGTYCCSA